VKSINIISKNKESISEKTYQGTSSLDFRLMLQQWNMEGVKFYVLIV